MLWAKGRGSFGTQCPTSRARAGSAGVCSPPPAGVNNSHHPRFQAPSWLPGFSGRRCHIWARSPAGEPFFRHITEQGKQPKEPFWHYFTHQNHVKNHVTNHVTKTAQNNYGPTMAHPNGNQPQPIQSLSDDPPWPALARAGPADSPPKTSSLGRKGCE